MLIRHIVVVVLVWLTMPLAGVETPTAEYSAALRNALLYTDAVAIVLDIDSGHLLAAEHADRAAMLLSSPGSVLKPFYLQTALDSGILQASTTVRCSRTLHIAGHTLNCGHPPDPPALNARQALAYSCNSYFAALALHLTEQQISATLHRYGIGESPHLFHNEATVAVRTPRTPQERQLLVLGITGVRVTVAQVAVAYRRLALAYRDHPDNPALATVWQGLEDSVVYGTSDNAAIPEMVTAGKTGTAADPDFARTHGWFVGLAPAAAPRILLVVYVPNGYGGDAAAIAHRFYLSASITLRQAQSQ